MIAAELPWIKARGEPPGLAARKVLINALTGKVSSRTQMSGNPTNQDSAKCNPVTGIDVSVRASPAKIPT
jgi:hypothetical protein